MVCKAGMFLTSSSSSFLKMSNILVIFHLCANTAWDWRLEGSAYKHASTRHDQNVPESVPESTRVTTTTVSFQTLKRGMQGWEGGGCHTASQQHSCKQNNTPPILNGCSNTLLSKLLKLCLTRWNVSKILWVYFTCPSCIRKRKAIGQTLLHSD